MKILLYLIDTHKEVKPDEKPIGECDCLTDAEDMAVKYANEHGLKGSEQIAILAGVPDDCVLIESVKAEYIPKRPEKVYYPAPPTVIDRRLDTVTYIAFAVNITLFVINLLGILRV